VVPLLFQADVLADRILRGRAKRLAYEKLETTQQTPLTVEAVTEIEKLMARRPPTAVEGEVEGQSKQGVRPPH